MTPQSLSTAAEHGLLGVLLLALVLPFLVLWWIARAVTRWDY